MAQMRLLVSVSVPHLTPLSFSALPAVKRLAVGFLYLVIYAIFSPYFPDSYFFTDKFEVRIASKKKSGDNLWYFLHYSIK